MTRSVLAAMVALGEVARRLAAEEAVGRADWERGFEEGRQYERGRRRLGVIDGGRAG